MKFNIDKNREILILKHNLSRLNKFIKALDKNRIKIEVYNRLIIKRNLLKERLNYLLKEQNN